MSVAVTLEGDQPAVELNGFDFGQLLGFGNAAKQKSKLNQLNMLAAASGNPLLGAYAAMQNQKQSQKNEKRRAAVRNAGRAVGAVAGIGASMFIPGVTGAIGSAGSSIGSAISGGMGSLGSMLPGGFSSITKMIPGMGETAQNVQIPTETPNINNDQPGLSRPAVSVDTNGQAVVSVPRDGIRYATNDTTNNPQGPRLSLGMMIAAGATAFAIYKIATGK